MTKYLLLRDNKQTGPYSSEELIQKGLKAYDLVWAEGKSAAWRYPSEIDELKSFAPAVEEQPFDRFFKKPRQEQKEVLQPAAKKPGQQQLEVPQPTAKKPGQEQMEILQPAATPAAASSPIDNNVFAVNASNPSGFPGESSTQQGKRIIYVTMPAGKAKPVNVVTEKQPTAYNNQAVENNRTGSAYDNGAGLQDDRARSFALPATIAQPVHLAEGQLSSIPGIVSEFSEDNITQPFNNGEINPRKYKAMASGRSRNILQPLMIAGTVLLLLAAGVFIGVSIDRNEVVKKLSFRQEAQAAATRPQSGQSPVSKLPPAITETNSLTTSGANASVLPADTMSSNAVTRQPVTSAAQPLTYIAQQPVVPKNTSAAGPKNTSAAVLKNIPATREKALLTAQKAPSPGAASVNTKDSAVTTYPIAHREASHRSDVSVDKMDKDLLRNNLSSLVSLGASHYSVGPFGGISGLQLTVSNRSVYALDLVVVEVQYIQSNKKVFKTENLYFRSIGAGAALMQEAPKSNRGIKVEYKITLVNSKELGLSYSAL